MATPTQDRERILQDILTWSVEEQIALAREILQRAEKLRQRDLGTQEQPAIPPVPSAALRGLLSNDQPAPSDEEVARWLDEARMEKYGG